MQQFSQNLAETRHANEILEIFFQVCTNVIGFDYVQMSMVQGREVRAVAGVGVSDRQLRQARKPLDSNDIMADIIRTGRTETITGWDERFDPVLYEQEQHATWQRVFTPIILHKNTIGLVEAGFFDQTNRPPLRDGQIRLLKSFIDQAVLALDNAQRYEIIERTARREAVIREISNKIRDAITVDDILQTTLTELGHLLGSDQGTIQLTTGVSPQTLSSVQQKG